MKKLPEISRFALDTSEAERTLAALIREHGYEAVREQLADIMPRADWPTYQRACNLARNVSNRLQREKKTRAK
jgi:Holliday junction resolvase